MDGQTGPQSGLPERVDASAWSDLYAAVAASPPPPGPSTLEQRIQELEWEDVAEDVLAAVDDLGSRAHRPEVVERAIEMGDWTTEELAARAWYTDGSESSHIRNIVAIALEREHHFTRRLEKTYGSSPYRLRSGIESPRGFGAPYRPAAAEVPAPDSAPHQVDLSALDAATARHMSLQNTLAEHLRERGIEPRSPGPGQPQFDLAFEYDGRRYIVEVKSGVPVSAQQVRLGVGQILEYCHLMQHGERVRSVLLLEGEPPHPWRELLARDLGIAVIRSDAIPASLDRLLATPAARGG